IVRLFRRQGIGKELIDPQLPRYRLGRSGVISRNQDRALYSTIMQGPDHVPAFGADPVHTRNEPQQVAIHCEQEVGTAQLLEPPQVDLSAVETDAVSNHETAAAQMNVIPIPLRFDPAPQLVARAAAFQDG